MAYKLEWADRAVFCRWSGTVVGGDLVTANQQIHSDARFDDLRYMLFLMNDVEQMDISIESIEQVAAMGIGAAKSNENLRCAMVSISDDMYGLASFYQMHMDEAGGPTWAMKLFRNEAAANDWLFEELVV